MAQESRFLDFRSPPGCLLGTGETQNGSKTAYFGQMREAKNG
jgi:hypothetical protein